MTWIDILIIVAAVSVTAGVIAAAIIRKKQGKTCCGSDCSSCAGCSACHVKKEKTEK